MTDTKPSPTPGSKHDPSPDMGDVIRHGRIQQGRMLPAHGLTEAIHIGENDLPWVDIGDGSTLQLLQVDLQQGLWVVRTRFQPGHVVSTHYHTGSVFAVTLSGAWYYAEYPDAVNRAGSYLFEPAHSLHTLVVDSGNDEVTDVWFAIYGANLNLDDAGDVVGVTDAQNILATYRALCSAQGVSADGVIVHGEPA